MSPEERRVHMGKIKSKNSKAELLVRRNLFKLGYRFRIHYKELPGCPDIVFTKLKIAIFVDGDFWHGRHFELKSIRYSDKWKIKILKNIERDKTVNSKLEAIQWTILRFWESDIIKNTPNVICNIERLIKEKRDILN